MRTVKRWTNEGDCGIHKPCFNGTDWSVFEAAAFDMDELTEIVTASVSVRICAFLQGHTLKYNPVKNGKLLASIIL